MKQQYITPRCKTIHIDSSEMLAQSPSIQKGGKASDQDAPRVMESNQRDHSIWDD